MDAVATGATNPGLGGLRALKIRMRPGMAGKAGCIDNLGRSLAELQDLRLIPSGFHMSLTRTVAALTGKAGATMHQTEGGMRIMHQGSGHGAMAEGTGLVTGKSSVRRTCLWGG